MATPHCKIYFCGSIRAGRGDVDLYGRIVKLLEKYGTVLTPFVADPNITHLKGEGKTDKEIHERDMRLLHECSVIVAEVTQPSLGVGYEIGRGVALQKRILCLYRPQPDKLLSAMIRGADKEGWFKTVDYEEENLPTILDDFFKTALRSRQNSIDWQSYEPM